MTAAGGKAGGCLLRERRSALVLSSPDRQHESASTDRAESPRERCAASECARSVCLRENTTEPVRCAS